VPELPEVESVRRQLAPRLIGRRVTAAWGDARSPRIGDLGGAVGATVLGLERRGKYLVAPLGPGGGPPDADLLAHLGMTGAFHFRGEDGWEPDAYVRATFDLSGPGGQTAVLDFRDVRRFGTLAVTPHGDHAGHTTLVKLGPEPLSDAFRPAGFHASLRRMTSTVKAALLSQRHVAGVGNIYADEALWRARIHPEARDLSRARSDRLWAAIREVLAEAITREGTTFRDYRMVNGESGRNADFLDAYGQAGRPCPRCGRPLVKAVVAGRGTTWCRTCQRR
jgi:formamidopyrimidine-DNA glycosylase